MAEAAQAQGTEPVDGPRCWCCGDPYEESRLTRLGSHPEVAVCAGCARWLSRRARASVEAGSGSPGARWRRFVGSARRRMMGRGWQDLPVVGALLRRLDTHLP